MTQEPLIYLDHNATTPVHPEVIQAMEPYWSKVYGNPSSLHRLGQEASRALERSRGIVAQSLGSEISPQDIIFVSGGTEANALALLGSLGREDRKHLLISPMEHDSIRLLGERLEKEAVAVDWLPVNQNGIVQVDALKKLLRPETCLVSVMLASHETGVIEPIAEIAQLLKERGIRFHVDCVQAMGKIPVNLNKMGCTSASFSGHKIGAPKGIGALWCHPDWPVKSLWPGHQERSRRPGTVNVALAVALAKAMELSIENQQIWTQSVALVRDYFEEKLLERISRVRINSKAAQRVPGTSHVSFDGVKGAELVVALDLSGIAVSTGSACSSGTAQPSAAIRAMGLEESWLRGSVRFSLGTSTTKADIDRTLGVLEAALARLRQ